MLLSRLFSASLCMLIALQLCSQSLKSDTDFSYVDSFARTVKYKNDILELTNKLTQPFPEQILKARAIFVWIADNIGYDYKFYNKDKQVKTPKCKQGKDCGLVFARWENKYLRKVIKKRKGVCDGYARLFNRMCEIAGLTSKIVSGYTKKRPYQIGNAGSVNHAWNVIWLDSSYYMIDATWAAGVCPENDETEKLYGFKKQFNNYHWLTPFSDFVRDRYPKDSKWVLEPNYTKEKFASNPYYAPDIISKIKLIKPESGIISAKKGDTIHFKFEYSGNIRYIQINSNLFKSPPVWHAEKENNRKQILKQDTLALKKQQYVTYRQNDNIYDFEYVVNDNALYYIDVLFDYRRVMRFKVNIDR